MSGIPTWVTALICHLIGNFTPDAQGVAGGGGGRRTGEFLGLKIALLVLLLLVGCSQKPSGPAAGSQAATRDASAVESLAEKDKCFPALEWLKNTSTNMLWKGDRAAILKHFEEQHKAGMTEITAVGVETMEGKQICASFVALLPPRDRPATRPSDCTTTFGRPTWGQMSRPKTWQTFR